MCSLPSTTSLPRSLPLSIVYLNLPVDGRLFSPLCSDPSMMACLALGPNGWGAQVASPTRGLRTAFERRSAWPWNPIAIPYTLYGFTCHIDNTPQRSPHTISSTRAALAQGSRFTSCSSCCAMPHARERVGRAYVMCYAQTTMDLVWPTSLMHITGGGRAPSRLSAAIPRDIRRVPGVSPDGPRHIHPPP